MNVELDPGGRIGCQLDLPGLGAKARDYVANGAALLKLCDHPHAIRRVFPDFQFMDSMAKHFFARIAVSSFEGAIYIQEPALLYGRDGKGNWAGAKDPLELLFGDLPVSLCLGQSGFGLLEVRDSFFAL